MKHPNKPLLIFDFDGTIVDSLTLGLKLMNQLAPKYGYELIESMETIRRQSGVKFIKQHIQWYKLPFWLRDLKKLVMNHLDEITIYPHLKDTLSELSKDYNLGIIGGGPNGYHHLLFSKFDIDVFDFVYSNMAYRKEKALKKVLKQYKDVDVVVIGDDLADIKSAKLVGLKTIAVSWGSTSSETLKTIDPDHLIDDQKKLYPTVKMCFES